MVREEDEKLGKRGEGEVATKLSCTVEKQDDVTRPRPNKQSFPRSVTPDLRSWFLQSVANQPPSATGCPARAGRASRFPSSRDALSTASTEMDASSDIHLCLLM